jgi:hypothetical protein
MVSRRDVMGRTCSAVSPRRRDASGVQTCAASAVLSCAATALPTRLRAWPRMFFQPHVVSAALLMGASRWAQRHEFKRARQLKTRSKTSSRQVQGRGDSLAQARSHSSPHSPLLSTPGSVTHLPSLGPLYGVRFNWVVLPPAPLRRPDLAFICLRRGGGLGPYATPWTWAALSR